MLTDDEDQKPKRKRYDLSKVSPKMLAVLTAVLVLVAGGGYLAYKYSQTQEKYDKALTDIKRLSDPQQLAKEQTQQLVQKVGNLVEVPSKETPTIATVSDVSKLKNQAFFANAQNGDKVLIYTQSKRAILYRPSTNKVIEVAPVNLGNNQN